MVRIYRLKKKIAQSFLAKLNGQDEANTNQESNPDILYIRRLEDKKEVAIAQIRALKDFASRTPLNLKTKAVIIEEAQYLNEESWNALLKTLEEPTSSTIVFILSSSLKSIPKTIFSRVASLSFETLLEDNVSGQKAGKDDIILNTLAGYSNMSLLERFDLAEKLAKEENIDYVLDNWLLILRSSLLEDSTSSSEKIKAIEAIINTKNILISTNASARLVLENLFLNI